MARELAPAWLIGPPRRHELALADWRESYKVHFRPWRLGRLHWVPVWKRGSYPVPRGDQVVWLDPGMAFGTGNHETTRLCCERIVAFAARVERPGCGLRARSFVDPKLKTQNSRLGVIDAGCGSGILAISAAKLGLGPVMGFDCDPDAVRMSRENAALNGVRPQIEFLVSDLGAGLAGRRADLVLANIQADVLLRHARALTRAVAPRGWLVLSGILATELRRTRAAFAAATAGWAVDARALGEWADLAFVRPAGRAGGTARASGP